MERTRLIDKQDFTPPYNAEAEGSPPLSTLSQVAGGIAVQMAAAVSAGGFTHYEETNGRDEDFEFPVRGRDCLVTE